MANLLWLSTSPSLKCFDVPLIVQLAQSHVLHLWEYEQSPDEAVSLNNAVHLLYDYFTQHFEHEKREPVHLMGHGISGVLGLLFARQHPEWVRSLTLLSVSSTPAVTWHTQYYAQRHLFVLPQSKLLMKLAYQLFKPGNPCSLKKLANKLQIDLIRSLCPHSLFDTVQIPQGGITAPLLVCGGQVDAMVDMNAIYDWNDWMHADDAVWLCPDGRHFFHYQFPEETYRVIQSFLQKVETPDPLPPCAPKLATVSND